MLSLRQSRKNPAIILIFIFVISLYLPWSGSSYADNALWLEEFNELCGDTQKAANLGKEDVKMLILRCDRLSSTLETSDSPQKKAYIYRVEKCKNFYQFLIELSEEERSK